MAVVNCVGRKAYRLDFPDFAQEFLRRNHEYQAQFRLLMASSRREARLPESYKMARLWGLEFPGRS